MYIIYYYIYIFIFMYTYVRRYMCTCSTCTVHMHTYGYCTCRQKTETSNRTDYKFFKQIHHTSKDNPAHSQLLLVFRSSCKCTHTVKFAALPYLFKYLKLSAIFVINTDLFVWPFDTCPISYHWLVTCNSVTFCAGEK